MFPFHFSYHRSSKTAWKMEEDFESRTAILSGKKKRYEIHFITHIENWIKKNTLSNFSDVWVTQYPGA